MSELRKLSQLSNDQELKLLLKKFIRKSEELEKRESKILQHVELAQSAVASLQMWQQTATPETPETPETPPTFPEFSLSPSPPSPLESPQQPPRIDVKQIEEETRLFREETGRIQQEIQEKIEQNKKLKEAAERRNSLMANRREIETWTTKSRVVFEDTNGPGIEHFLQKLNNLQAREKRLKKQLESQAGEARKKETLLEEKIRQMEKEAELEKKLLEGGKRFVNLR